MSPAVENKLYAPKDSFRTQRILVAAQYSGVDVKLVPDFKLGVTNVSDSFKQKFPFGQVPALEHCDGVNISETSAISQLVGSKVAGQDEHSRAQVAQWVSLADSEFLPAVLGWVLPSLSAMQFNKQQVEASRAELLRLLGVLNAYLLPRTYLVGERVSLADITLACNLLLAYQHVLEPSVRDQFINVTRWFETCVNQPHFKAVLGETQLCAKAAEFDAKKLKAAQAKSEAAASGKKDKKAGGGAVGGDKKAAGGDKKKGDKEPAEPMDETEMALAQEEKKKDPFDAFPKGTLNMDEFKRVYSNEDTLTKAIPYFWDHFDKENFSLWYCEYKYPEDLQLVFMSCNLIGGMFQRLDKMRKHAFGSMILFGENHKSTISGLWFWRSHELAFTLSPDWQIDFESYEWKKLDPEAEDTKTLVKEYLMWEGDFGGKKFNQGKIFK